MDEAALARLPTAFSSVGIGFGVTICHCLDSVFLMTVFSPLRGSNSNWRMSDSFTERILGLASLGGAASLAASFLLDHHSTPPRTANSAAATISRMGFMAVSITL